MISVADPSTAVSREFVDEPRSFQAPTPPSENIPSQASMVVVADGAIELRDIAREGDPADMMKHGLDQMVLHTQRVVERHPNNQLALRNLGLAMMNAGRHGDAVDALLAAKHLAPQDPRTRIALAQGLTGLGKLDDAIRVCEEVLTDRPTYLPGRVQLAYLALRTRQLPRALDLWRECVGSEPEVPAIRYWLGMTLLEKRGGASEAIHHLRIATRLDPRSAVLYNGLGIAYAVRGLRDRAQQAFRAAIRLSPLLYAATHGLVVTMLEDGRVDEAAEVAFGYLAEHSSVESHELVARALLAKRLFGDARTHLFRAYQLLSDRSDPNAKTGARLANNLAVCYWNLGNLAEAKRFVERSLVLDPADTLVPTRNLIGLLLDVGKVAQALEIATECVASHPEDEPALLLLSVALTRSDRAKEAIERLDEWVDRGSATAKGYAALGGLLLDEGDDVGRGQETLRNGLTRYPNDLNLRNNLAYGYLLEGRVDAARDILKNTPTPDDDVRTAVVLTATRGLLRIWEGDLVGGGELYRQAEELAARDHDEEFARTVRQKRHLELAKAKARQGDVSASVSEARVGLAIQGKSAYARQLAKLAGARTEDT